MKTMYQKFKFADVVYIDGKTIKDRFNKPELNLSFFTTNSVFKLVEWLSTEKVLYYETVNDIKL